MILCYPLEFQVYFFVNISDDLYFEFVKSFQMKYHNVKSDTKICNLKTNIFQIMWLTSGSLIFKNVSNYLFVRAGINFLTDYNL